MNASPSTRGLGCRPDPEDARDRELGQLLGVLASSPPPASASVAHPLVVPRDQGPTQSCTGQAVAQAVRLAYLAQGVECPDLSALAPYWWGRSEWGGERVDDGSHLRTTIRAVQRFGCPSEEAWPFAAARVQRSPGWAATRDAYDRRGVRGYYRIVSGDVDGVRRAIAAGLPVVGGWRVDRPFTRSEGPLVIDAPQESTIGGHAVVLEDYEPDGTFGLLNSWGTSWRNGGRARVTETFVSLGQDLWAIDVEATS